MSCDSSFKIDDFYSDLDSRNYTVSDNELTQRFIGENIVMFDAINQISTGVVKMSQGIFEIYQTSNGDYAPHGMITSNTELDILDGCNNFHDLTYIPRDYWTFVDENTYKLTLNSGTFNVLASTRYFNLNDKDSIKEVSLKRVEKHTYDLSFTYKSSSSDKDYVVSLTNYGQNHDEKLENYVKNTIVNKQTNWNDYQMSALTNYGYEEVPFLSSLTLGMKLLFLSVPGYYGGGYVLFIYDCLGSASQINDIKTELTSLGFHKRSERVFYKETNVAGYTLNCEFAYISYEEIKVMVEHGEASEGDLLAYPTGYTQLVFSYGIAEQEVSLDVINDKFTNHMELSPLEDASFINKIMMVDYTESYNDIAIHDEEYLEMFHEMGLEPGPIYEEMCSIYLYIDKESDAANYIDTYRNTFKDNGYKFYSLYEEDTEEKSIVDMTFNCVQYNKTISDTNLNPVASIDIYMFDSTTTLDYSYDGVVEIVISRYTELGIEFFYGI